MLKDNLKKNTICNDTYFTATHSSGLKVMLYPKSDYSTTYAIFGTNYGSVDVKFKRSDENDFFTVPAGVAHFLEHKLFESEDIPVFEQYAKTGASGNAYTSFDKTCYLFSCSEKVMENLTILLNFVQHPYFTKENVEKEQGIIGQEIKMYEDNPQWKCLFNLLECLYHDNCAKINIAGTVDSISEITAETLYRCYNTFYSLPNMVFAVAGNFNVDEVCDLIDKLVIEKEKFTVERVVPNEPTEIVKGEIVERMSVQIPIFSIGFKENVNNNYRTVRETLECEIMIELFSSQSSDLYEKLIEKKLINESFECEYFAPVNTSSVIFSGESNKPYEVYDEIKKEIQKVKTSGIDELAFQNAKKVVYGRKVASLGKMDAIANNMAECELYGQDFSQEIALCSTITKADIMRRIDDILDIEKSAISIIMPK